jgi:hypothetical protein
MLYPDIQVKE